MQSLKLFLVAACLSPCALLAQGPDAPPGATAVVYNWQENSLINSFPFDKPIYLIIQTGDKFPPEAVRVRVSFGKGLSGADLKLLGEFREFRNGNFYIPLDVTKVFTDDAGKQRFLEPARNYTYEFVFLKENGDVISSAGVKNGASTKTKFGHYLKPDFGFGYAPHVNAMIGFTSAHLYLTAVNDDTDLADIASLKRNILLRTGFFFGLSPVTIHSDTRQPISKLGGAGNFIYGVSIRSPFYGYALKSSTARTLLQPMRLHLGQVVFKQANENSLIAAEQTKQAFYIGLSYDLNIGGLFGEISNLYAP